MFVLTQALKNAALQRAGRFPRLEARAHRDARARARAHACTQTASSGARPQHRHHHPPSLPCSFQQLPKQHPGTLEYAAAYGHMACQAAVVLEPASTEELATALAAQRAAAAAAGKALKVRATHRWVCSTDGGAQAKQRAKGSAAQCEEGRACTAAAASSAGWPIPADRKQAVTHADRAAHPPSQTTQHPTGASTARRRSTARPTRPTSTRRRARRRRRRSRREQRRACTPSACSWGAWTRCCPSTRRRGACACRPA